MIPFWGILYGIAWLAWLACAIGGLGNQRLLGIFSEKAGYTPSEQYLRGLDLSLMERNADSKSV